MRQDLVILGLLKEGPKHGYEIKKSITRTLNTFTNLDSKSIYYPLKRLEEKGLVVKYLGRKGKRPEKYIYKITPQGEEAFERLLGENFLTFERPIFNVDLSLYFLPLVKAKMARSRLRGRLRGMKRIMRWLKEKKSQLAQEGQSYYLLAIIAHQIALTEADINFTQGLIEHLTMESEEH